jgi:hypothetical protein
MFAPGADIRVSPAARSESRCCVDLRHARRIKKNGGEERKTHFGATIALESYRFYPVERMSFNERAGCVLVWINVSGLCEKNEWKE